MSDRSTNYDFTAVRVFLFFIGHPRSGTTLMANIIDAHPNAIVAFQHNALEEIRAGKSREHLFESLVNNSLYHSQQDTLSNGYGYQINEYQGRAESLYVIGDKTAARSSKILGNNLHLINQIRNVVKMPIRILHMTRNPYDVIATMAKRNGQIDHISDTVETFRNIAYSTQCVIDNLESDEYKTVRLEDMISSPKDTIEDTINWLGLASNAYHLETSVKIVFSHSNQSRHAVQWTPQIVRTVESMCAEYPFLNSYKSTAIESMK